MRSEQAREDADVVKGHSVWEFARVDPGAAARFLVQVAMLRKDGEGLDEDGDPQVMENDDAYDTLHGLISEARGMLGWTAGTAPLDQPGYASASEGREP